MIRALMDGSKSQTRRIVKPQPAYVCGHDNEDVYHPNEKDLLRCKFGADGDQLWVRETWRTYASLDYLPPSAIEPGAGVQYEALGTNLHGDKGDYLLGMGKVRPSIFMPRWASRITLEIVSVRVERLQDIGEDDAKAEGLKGITKDGKLVKYGIPDADGYPGTDDIGWPWEDWRISPVDAYRKLWESINGPGSWDENPFVWCISFRRVKQCR